MVRTLDFAYSPNPHQRNKLRKHAFNPSLPQEQPRKGTWRVSADMSTEMSGLREQIIANAKYMMFSTVHQSNTPADNADNADTGSKLPTVASVATLVAPDNPAAIGPSAARPENIDIVVFGDEKEFTAAVMCGIHPVIEGATGSSPEGAMRKLLMATSELLNTIMPKLGSHQRNIHGGGVVDEDFLSRGLLDKKV